MSELYTVYRMGTCLSSDETFVATRKVLFEKYNPNKLIFTSTPIGFTTRKIKAKWTVELAQDLTSFHNIDAEKELTELLLNQNIENIQTRKVLIEKTEKSYPYDFKKSEMTRLSPLDYYRIWNFPEMKIPIRNS